MHTGVFHFSSISMQVLPLHYAKDVLSFGYGPYFADSTFNDFVRKQSLIPSFKEKFQISIDFSTSIIKEHSMLFLVKHLRGLFSFFLDNGRHFIYESVGYIPKNEVSFLYLLDSKGWIKGTIMYFGLLNAFEIAIISFIFLWNVISLVMLIVYPFARNEKIEIKIFLLLIIWYVANFSTFTNYARFKVCVFPLLVYIIIVSLDFLLKYKLHFDAKQPIKKITIAY
ncbi:MAG: hypothetical protein SFY32_08365 [Bacteroidota bacterium]|nr:hypothetical protein [Bacteroidota bacterium]